MSTEQSHSSVFNEHSTSMTALDQFLPQSLIQHEGNAEVTQSPTSLNTVSSPKGSLKKIQAGFAHEVEFDSSDGGEYSSLSDREESSGGLRAVHRQRRRRHTTREGAAEAVVDSRDLSLTGGDRLKDRLAAHRLNSLSAKQLSSSNATEEDIGSLLVQVKGLKKGRLPTSPPLSPSSRRRRKASRQQRASNQPPRHELESRERWPPSPSNNSLDGEDGELSDGLEFTGKFGEGSDDDEDNDDSGLVEDGRAGRRRRTRIRRRSPKNGSSGGGPVARWRSRRDQRSDAVASAARKEVARELHRERADLISDYGSTLAHVLFSTCLALLALYFVGSMDGVVQVITIEFKFLAGLVGAAIVLFGVEVVLARRRDRRFAYTQLPSTEKNLLVTAPPSLSTLPEGSSLSTAAEASAPTADDMRANPLNDLATTLSSGEVGPDASGLVPVQNLASVASLYHSGSGAPAPPGAASLSSVWPLTGGVANERVGNGNMTQARAMMRCGSRDDEEEALGLKVSGSSL